MTDDRVLRQLLEETQAQLKHARAQVEDLESRHWLVSLRAHSETERAQQLEKEAARLRAQLGSLAQGDLEGRFSTLQGQLAEVQERLEHLDQELPPTASRLDVCAKCGSREVIPGASIKDAHEHPVSARVLRDPHSFFSHPQRVDLITWLCGSCGYAEVFAEHPEVLYGAYLEYKRNVKKR